jgi:branched-chain amino acid aminotransferase
MLPRELLYIADEAFFAGTAVEITPIKTVDKLNIGNGRRGPITEAIQQQFFDIIGGSAPDKHGWLEFVYEGEPRESVATGKKSARA